MEILENKLDSLEFEDFLSKDQFDHQDFHLEAFKALGL